MQLSCRACKLSATYDERFDAYKSFPWRRAGYRSTAPDKFLCPRCHGARIDGADNVERSVAEGYGADLYCWTCGCEERDADGSETLARWRNPAFDTWEAETMGLAGRRDAVREARAAADKARIDDRWPWRARVRTDPQLRRARVPVPPWLEVVTQDPDDLYARLDAADFIERDDPERARFIRCDIEGDDANRDLQIAQWSPELAVLATERLIADRGFICGFVEHVTMNAADFATHADEIFERAPIQFLTLTNFDSNAHAAAAQPRLARVRGLRLAALLPGLALDFRRDGIGNNLATYKVNKIDDACIEALTESDLRALELLDVTQAEISIAGWVRLAQHAPLLRHVIDAPCPMITDYDLDDFPEVPNPVVREIEDRLGCAVPWSADDPLLSWWQYVLRVASPHRRIKHDRRIKDS